MLLIVFFLLLFITRTQRIFLLFNSVGYSLQQDMRHRDTLRLLNKLALPQSPLQATQLKIYVYIVNFCREIYNTPCIIDQLIYIS